MGKPNKAQRIIHRDKTIRKWYGYSVNYYDMLHTCDLELAVEYQSYWTVYLLQGTIDAAVDVDVWLSLHSDEEMAAAAAAAAMTSY